TPMMSTLAARTAASPPFRVKAKVPTKSRRSVKVSGFITYHDSSFQLARAGSTGPVAPKKRGHTHSSLTPCRGSYYSKACSLSSARHQLCMESIVSEKSPATHVCPLATARPQVLEACCDFRTVTPRQSCVHTVVS